MKPAPDLWPPEKVADAWLLFESLVLDTGERWGSVMLPWQRAAFASTLGLPGAPSGDRDLIWVEGPTGCGKDQVIAADVIVATALLDGFEVQLYSSDRERNADVVKTIRGFIRRTVAENGKGEEIRPLADEIQLVRHEIRCARTGSTARVDSLDGASASGSRADLYIANEVQSWPDPNGTRVWDESLARYDKVAHGRYAVFSNAPFTPTGDWRRDEREKAMAGGEDSPWWFLGVTLADCPWMTPEKLEKKRKTLAPHVYRRLYLCVPTDGRGELVTPEVARAAESDMHRPAIAAKPGARYIHALDIGVVRDHAVHMVLHREPDHRILLDRLEVWVPPKGGQVDLSKVEDHVEAEMRRFPGHLFADPHQAVSMVQRLTRRGLKVTEVPFTAIHLTQMCEAVRGAYNDQRLVLWENAGLTHVTERISTSLTRQVLDAEVVEQERGARIRSPRTKAGHGDQLSALALALWGLAKLGITGPSACVGSGNRAPDPDAPAPRPRFEPRARLRPHAGVYLGPRATGRRRVVR